MVPERPIGHGYMRGMTKYTDSGYVAAFCLIAVLFLTLRLLRNLGVLSFGAREEKES